MRSIPEALSASPAIRVYVCNLMTQANESIGLTASQHIAKIMLHSNNVQRPLFDYAIINTGPISPVLLNKYALEGQTPIEADLDAIRILGVEPITGNFVHEGDVLRHNYDKVAETCLELAMRPRPLAQLSWV